MVGATSCIEEPLRCVSAIIFLFSNTNSIGKICASVTLGDALTLTQALQPLSNVVSHTREHFLLHTIEHPSLTSVGSLLSENRSDDGQTTTHQAISAYLYIPRQGADYKHVLCTRHGCSVGETGWFHARPLCIIEAKHSISCIYGLIRSLPCTHLASLSHLIHHHEQVVQLIHGGGTP